MIRLKKIKALPKELGGILNVGTEMNVKLSRNGQSKDEVNERTQDLVAKEEEYWNRLAEENGERIQEIPDDYLIG